MACIAGAGVSLGLKFLGPESTLVGEISIDSENSPLTISNFPYFCEEVTAVSKSSVPNVTVTLYLADLPHESTSDLKFECTMETIKNESCSLKYVPLEFDNTLYGRIDAQSMDVVVEGHVLADLSISCRTRVLLYTVLSLATFTFVILSGLVCICCCASACCRPQKYEGKGNLFIYTPLLDAADHGPEDDPREHTLMVRSVNTPDGVVPTLDRTELSSSYKYSSFKPGTKTGNSFKSHHYSSPKKQKSPEVKRNYATISGTYTFQTFKPEN